VIFHKSYTIFCSRPLEPFGSRLLEPYSIRLVSHLVFRLFHFRTYFTLILLFQFC
jgi:hypothetical protein